MRRKTAIVSLLLAITLIYSPLAMAQQTVAPGDWSAVQDVPPGDELVIQRKDGTSVKGKVSSVTSDELSLTRKNKTEIVRRDSISQIHQLKRKAEREVRGHRSGPRSRRGFRYWPGKEFTTG